MISRPQDGGQPSGLCPPAGLSLGDLHADLRWLPCSRSEGTAQVMGKVARLRGHRAAHTAPPPLAWFGGQHCPRELP